MPAFGAVAVAFVLACALVPAAAAVGRRWGILDHPAGELTIHSTPVPRTGGLAIVAGFLAAVGVAWAGGMLPAGEGRLLVGLVLGGVIVAGAGLLDDIRHISPTLKFLWQLFGAAVAVGCGVQVGLIPLTGVGAAFSIIYLVGGANGLNLLDGMNGMAAGTAAIAAGFLALLAAGQGAPLVLVLGLALLGAALGFLPYNFPRARLFMGDVGSLFLGFLLAGMAALLTAEPYDVPCFLAPLVVLGLPLADTALAMARRFARMDDLFTGDREHLYDLLAARGLGETWSVVSLWGVSLGLGGLAVSVGRASPLVAVALSAAGLAGVLALGLWVGAAGGATVPAISLFGRATRRLFRRYASPLLLDTLLIVVCFYLALALRFSGEVPGDYVTVVAYAHSLTAALPFVVVVYLLVNGLFGLYSRLWQYASSQEAVSILGSGGVATGVVLLFDGLWKGHRPIPLSVVLMAGLGTIMASMVYRYRWRLATGLLWRLGVIPQDAVGSKRILIVGAGEAGQLLAWRVQNQNGQYRVVGFVDDDPDKVGMQVHGVKVLGKPEDIPEIVSAHQVDTIVVAAPCSVNGSLAFLIAVCHKTPARVKILPDLDSLLEDAGGVNSLRDVTLEDVLSRRPAPRDEAACRQVIEGKTVLVTGAAGSIGSELCRQVIHFGTQQLIALDNNETGLYNLTLTLAPPDGQDVYHVVGDVTDRSRLDYLLRQYRPEVVFHAAAYKHVSLMETCPEEVIRVNLGGTQMLAELAMGYGVGKFVFISSDKAVHPANVMGASKRLGELLLTAEGIEGDTQFTVVRFGNVFGSRGSVVPTFWRQIERGGPVTVTHPQATRFFMDVREAVSLVIQAAAFTQGGDIFVLDMGEPVRINELAEQMIRLRGLEPGTDVPIIHTGLRPGEKLGEELYCPRHEKRLPTPHPHIWHLSPHYRAHYQDVQAWMRELTELCHVTHDGQLASRLLSLAQDLRP